MFGIADSAPGSATNGSMVGEARMHRDQRSQPGVERSRHAPDLQEFVGGIQPTVLGATRSRRIGGILRALQARRAVAVAKIDQGIGQRRGRRRGNTLAGEQAGKKLRFRFVEVDLPALVDDRDGDRSAADLLGPAQREGHAMLGDQSRKREVHARFGERLGLGAVAQIGDAAKFGPCLGNERRRHQRQQGQAPNDHDQRHAAVVPPRWSAHRRKAGRINLKNALT